MPVGVYAGHTPVDPRAALLRPPRCYSSTEPISCSLTAHSPHVTASRPWEGSILALIQHRFLSPALHCKFKPCLLSPSPLFPFLNPSPGTVSDSTGIKGSGSRFKTSCPKPFPFPLQLNRGTHCQGTFWEPKIHTAPKEDGIRAGQPGPRAADTRRPGGDVRGRIMPCPVPSGVTQMVFGILPVPAGGMWLWCSPSASPSSSTATSPGNLSL